MVVTHCEGSSYSPGFSGVSEGRESQLDGIKGGGLEDLGGCVVLEFWGSKLDTDG